MQTILLLRNKNNKFLKTHFFQNIFLLKKKQYYFVHKIELILL